MLQGNVLDPSKPEHKLLKGEAMEALSKLHSLDVVHGDIRCDNIIVADEGGQLPVVFLDFGHADLAAGPKAFRRDMQDLKWIFKNLTDPL